MFFILFLEARHIFVTNMLYDIFVIRKMTKAQGFGTTETAKLFHTHTEQPPGCSAPPFLHDYRQKEHKRRRKPP